MNLNGGLSQLHSADDEAVAWLTNYGSWCIRKKKKKITKDARSSATAEALELLSTAAQLYKKSHSNDLESDSRSLELPLFDSPYHFLLVVCSNN